MIASQAYQGLPIEGTMQSSCAPFYSIKLDSRELCEAEMNMVYLTYKSGYF